MEEVSNPYGLSGRDQQDPATLSAWQQGMSLKDKEVIDVNGVHLGKVTRAFAEDGALIRFDVTLSNQAKRILDAPMDVAGVPAVAIAEVTDDAVKLSEAGEQLVRPEDPVPSHATMDERGAPDLPRKNR